MKYIGRFVGGGKSSTTDHGVYEGVDGRVGALEVATGEGTVCNTVTILIDLDGTSMLADIVGGVHEQTYIRARGPRWL